MGVEGGSFPPQAAAAYFHLYGIGRDDADYILETFPIVRRKGEQAHGEYRTKRIAVLHIEHIIPRKSPVTRCPFHKCATSEVGARLYGLGG